MVIEYTAKTFKFNGLTQFIGKNDLIVLPDGGADCRSHEEGLKRSYHRDRGGKPRLGAERQGGSQTQGFVATESEQW